VDVELILVSVKVIDDSNNNRRHVEIQVEGGMPPYTVNLYQMWIASVDVEQSPPQLKESSEWRETSHTRDGCRTFNMPRVQAVVVPNLHESKLVYYGTSYYAVIWDALGQRIETEKTDRYGS
jgi:hypothetical protein